MPVLTTTATNMAGGAATAAGTGLDERLTVGGTWTVGDLISMTLTDSFTGVQTLLGAGDVTALTPTFVFSFKQKLYVCVGSKFAFSAIDDPTTFNDLNTAGNGIINVTNFNNSPESTVAIASYQGHIAVFCRNTVQVWLTNADPAQYQELQNIQNIGTFAKASVQSVGDLDVLFLADTGVRSLRVRDSSLNAYVIDIGSPIDALLQADLIAVGAAKVNATAVVEPSTNQYWLAINGKIYVLSYFPTLKITAWSTFDPTYQATSYSRFVNNAGAALQIWVSPTNDFTKATEHHASVASGGGVQAITMIPGGYLFTALVGDATPSDHIAIPLDFNGTIQYDFGPGLSCHYNRVTFTPEKFLVYNGQVFVRSTQGQLLVYGGTDNNTYDDCVANGELPWLDAKDPKKNKFATRLDCAMQGMWQIEAGMDPRGTTPTIVAVPFQVAAYSNANDSTYDNGSFAFSLQGTHFKAKFYTSPLWASPAKFSSITAQFKPGKDQ